MSAQVKPCPFCGGEAQVNTCTSTWWKFEATCANEQTCFVARASVKGHGRDDVIAEWNTRALAAPVVVSDEMVERAAECYAQQRYALPLDRVLPSERLAVHVFARQLLNAALAATAEGNGNG